MRKALVVLGVFLFSALSLSAQVTNAKILEYGIYTAKSADASDWQGALTGSRNVIDGIKFIQNTDKIPAKLETRFGFRFVVEGETKGEAVVLKKKVIHPAITEKGKTTTSHEYDLECNVGQSLVTGYRFGAANLMAPGEWKFQLFHEGKMLLEQKFVVN